MAYPEDQIGPRMVGGRYYNGYWSQTYTVEEIKHPDERSGWAMRVRWSDGHRTVHCTAWNGQRDAVLRQPESERVSIRDWQDAIPGYWDDLDFPPDKDIPHVHRCVDCGGWIIRHDVDNTSCAFCEGDRPRCHHCRKGA